MRKFGSVVLVLPVLLASCAGTRHGDGSYASRVDAVMKPWEELKEQKASLWELGWEPQVFEFEGEGKITVSNWALTGWPGEVYVSARVRYENTTDHPVQHAIVWLEVLDSQDRVAGSSGVRLINPLGYPLWPGHTVTRHIRTPTNGAHLDSAGWQWGVACSSLVEDDPGTKPGFVVPPDTGTNRAALAGATGDDSWRKAPRPREYNGTYYRRRNAPVHTPGVNPWDR